LTVAFWVRSDHIPLRFGFLTCKNGAALAL
jgi:hypothetical protein